MEWTPWVKQAQVLFIGSDAILGWQNEQTTIAAQNRPD